MMRIALSLTLTLTLTLTLILSAAMVYAGNMYRWVDKDGKVHYTDQLPPPEAMSAERKKLGDKGVDAAMPYSLQRATKNFPVTLYNANDCGDPCKLGMALLNKRGVPFSEKNARDPNSAAELTGLTGGKLEVPVLMVGRTTLRGYEEAGWNNALDAAGYPSTAMLPRPPAGAPAKPGTAAKQTAPAPKDAAAKEGNSTEQTPSDSAKPPS